MMNTADEPTHDVFLNVRNAYRLLHDYQRTVLDAVRYMRSQLDLDIKNFNAYQRFGDAFSDGSQQTLDRSSWAWLPMVSCEFHFYKKLPGDDHLHLSFFVISDSGYFERNVDPIKKEQLSGFLSSKESSTRFAFILRKDPWVSQIHPFMEDKTQMSNFLKKENLPDDLIKAGVVGKCYDMSCLISETEANKVVADVIKAAQEKSWPLNYRKNSKNGFNPHTPAL